VELVALGTLAGAITGGLLFTPLVRHWARRCDFVDHPGERKIHASPIAYGGGIAVALTIALALGAVWTFVTPRPFSWLVLLGAAGALVLGLVDDKIRLSPRAKLAGQFVLAIMAVAGGVRITALIGDTLPMQAATVLWIVLITNSFNLLDNMDGLCAGTAAIAAFVLGIVAVQTEQWAMVFPLAALCGACIGFLRYNRSPASIFLGDAGSLLIGYLMACLTVLVTYYRYREPSHLGLGIPILVLAIPLYDTFSVIVIRLREGRPIMRGDTSHFSHRLVDLGMTRRQAVTTIHLACLAIGLPATVLGQLSESSGLLIVGQACLVLTLVALLEHAGRARARGETTGESFAAKAPAAPPAADSASPNHAESNR